MQKNLITTDTEIAYHVVSQNPLIIVTNWDWWETRGTVNIFSEILKDRKTYFFYRMTWFYEERQLHKIAETYHEYKRLYPNYSFIFLCNTSRQYELLKTSGVPCIFCNHTALTDERLYCLEEMEKKFDAIYNAQIARFKRHYLASQVKNLALITYMNTSDFKDKLHYYLETKKVLEHVTWLNDPVKKGYKYFNPKQISLLLNTARVGLCLSAGEGAMQSCAEYMLCGLPIVSTKSRGGRDIFFEKEYVEIVDDSPEAVKEGVDKLITRNIQPNYVRDNILQKFQDHRQRFIDKIQEIFEREGKNENFAEQWGNTFTNKMLKWQKISNLKASI